MKVKGSAKFIILHGMWRRNILAKKCSPRKKLLQKSNSLVALSIKKMIYIPGEPEKNPFLKIHATKYTSSV